MKWPKNLWVAAKAVLRGNLWWNKFASKQEKPLNNLTLCAKGYKKNKGNPSWEGKKTIRGDKWIKNWKTDKMKETNSWFFWRVKQNW